MISTIPVRNDAEQPHNIHPRLDTRWVRNRSVSEKILRSRCLASQGNANKVHRLTRREYHKDKKPRKTTVSARDQKIAKIVVDSVWRVKTADKETTSTGREVLSGWQRCKILERLDATGDASESVRVQYLDDESDDESIEYTISDFIRSADPAPIHVDLTDVTSSVSREQPAFQMPDRGELVPLQRKRVRNPASWANHGSTFDTTWGNTFNLEGQGRHVVPECTVKDCDLDCAKITHDVLVHARNT